MDDFGVGAFWFSTLIIGLLYVAGVVLAVWITYWIIRTGVRDGIIRAWEYRAKKAQKIQ